MDKLPIHDGTKFGVLGLGVSGKAAAQYALQRGCTVHVSDIRPEEEFIAQEKEFLESTSIHWECGDHTEEFFRNIDLLFVSPGIDLKLPAITNYRLAGGLIVGELAVVAEEIQVPLIAVTGTNGKTTVTTMIGDLLRESGKRVFVGGNIGTPLFQYLTSPTDFDVVVAEVSSFQLETCGSFAPDIGIVLNITPDHLDRHGSLKEYKKIKMSLFSEQSEHGIAIINGDDSECRELPKQIRSTFYSFGYKTYNTVTISDGLIILNLHENSEEYDVSTFAVSRGVGAYNCGAAILAARIFGCSQSEITKALKAFSPLPHRMEYVDCVDGIQFYNDSKATNSGAVIGALSQFSEGVILIAGGKDKGDNYRLLRESVSRCVKKVILFGEAAPLLHDALSDLVSCVEVFSMEQAVKMAADSGVQGDTVLLSPSCASFDMFTSYGQRGDIFKAEVAKLLSDESENERTLVGD